MEEQVLVAGCVILDDYGRILLMHRDLGETGLWELPGGKVEEDEDPEQTAVREIHEELGVTVQLTKSLGSAAFEYQDTAYLFHWFQAKVAQGEPHITEADTFNDLDYFELDDMPSLALSAAAEILENKIIGGEVVLD